MPGTEGVNILQISTRDLGGGAEGSAWNLFRSYRGRGHRSWLAVGWKHGDDPDVFEIPRMPARVPWAHLCWILHGRLAVFQGRISGVSRLRHLLRTLAGGKPEIERWMGREDFNHPGSLSLLQLAPERPDLVHAHNLHGGYFDLRFLTRLSYQVPVILNLRDMWLLTGHCAHSLGCDRWRTGCGACPDLSLYPSIKRDAARYNWRRKRSIYERSRLYISTPSQWLMDQVRVSMLRGLEYRVISNAIDLTVFKPGSRPEARRQLRLPSNARIVMLTAHNPFKDYVMMESVLSRVVKDGEELLFICLGKLGESCVLGDGRVIYPGFERDPERMASYYCAADVFIHAAKGEAFGKTITEAMACGTPVVATSIGGVPELIDEGLTGYLVPRGDDAAMAERIQLLLDNPTLRKQMQKRASIAARQRFDLNRQVGDFLSWYQEILEHRATEHDKALPDPD